MHELLHIVGFQHEQTRSDRDDYVDVIFDNIVQQGSYHLNFNRHDTNNLVVYDYNSGNFLKFNNSAESGYAEIFGDSGNLEESDDFCDSGGFCHSRDFCDSESDDSVDSGGPCESDDFR